MAIQCPNAVGIFLCGKIILDEITRNLTLENTFHNLGFNTFPSPPALFEVYSELTDGLGQVIMKLAVTDCATLDEIYSRSRKVSFQNPFQRKGLLWTVRSCSFPAAGRYEFTLFADGDALTQTTIQVFKKEVYNG